MKFPFYINVSWAYFCFTLGAMLVAGFVMYLQSKKFYTLHVFVRKFSILDLEFPVSSLELATYIRGIFLLPPELSKESLRALKGQLYVHFLFIPLQYGSIFLLCMQVSHKLTFLGNHIFALLAWIQIIPLICDVIENIYLLQKIRPDVAVSTDSVHSYYQLAGKIKWAIALVALVFCISTLFYFWLTGNYSDFSTHFLLIILAEFLVIFILMRMTVNSSKIDLSQYQNIGN